MFWESYIWNDVAASLLPYEEITLLWNGVEWVEKTN